MSSREDLAKLLYSKNQIIYDYVKLAEGLEMDFVWNGITWHIKVVNEEFINTKAFKEFREEQFVSGLCEIRSNTIYIAKELFKDNIMEKVTDTLVHELYHCYLCTFVTSELKTYTEEELCDIAERAFRRITEVVEDFLEVYDERKCI